MNFENQTLEISAESFRRRDFLVEPKALAARANGRQAMLDVESFDEPLTLDPLAVGQLASLLDIPVKYARRMQAEVPALFADTVNTWLWRQADPLYLRVSDRGGYHSCDAVLSPSYRAIDNGGVMKVTKQLIDRYGLQVQRVLCQDGELAVQLYSPKTEREIFPGDPVRLGLSITNSEVGTAALTIAVRLFFLVCKNGAQVPVRLHGFSFVHRGSRLESSDSPVWEIPGAVLEERAAGPLALVQETGERIAKLTDGFDYLVDKFNDARIDTLGGSETVTELLARRAPHLAEATISRIVRHYEAGHAGTLQATRYGVAQAVTRAAQDESTLVGLNDLERLGGELLLH